MNRFSKKSMRPLAALVLCLIMLVTAAQTAMAASIDYGAKGSMTLNPTYNGNSVNRGTFAIYLVATLDQNAGYSFTLTGAYAAAAADYGLDINNIETSTEVYRAAAILENYTSAASRAATLNVAQENTAYELDLGIYLVVQTATTGNYTAARSFLVAIPVSNDAGDGWDYDITANPKLGYDAPTTTTTTSTPTSTTTTVDRAATQDPSTNIADQDTPLATISEPEGIDIGEDDVPLGDAPQTGMLQWPIPILSILGVGCIAGGASLGNDKKKREG